MCIMVRLYLFNYNKGTRYLFLNLYGQLFFFHNVLSNPKHQVKLVNKSVRYHGRYQWSKTANTSGGHGFIISFEWGSRCSIVSLLCSVLYFTVSPVVICRIWPVHCLFLFALRILITLLQRQSQFQKHKDGLIILMLVSHDLQQHFKQLEFGNKSCLEYDSM